MADKKLMVEKRIEKIGLSGAYAGDDTVLLWDYDLHSVLVMECELCFSTEGEIDEFSEILKDMVRSHNEKPN